MSKTKVTLLINAQTIKSDNSAGRTGGWSESFYSSLATMGPDIRARANALATLRAALLPANASVVGYRIHQVDPVGPSRSFENRFAGDAANAQDLPQVALQWKMRSTEGFNNRVVEVRGAPDGLIIKGEPVLNAAYIGRLQAYFAELKASWLMKGRIRTHPTIKVGTVSAAGVVHTQEPHDLEEGSDFIFLRTRNVDEELVKGVFTVTEVTTETDFVIWNWANDGYGEIKKGHLRFHEEDYFQLDIDVEEVNNPHAVTREVGRPFGQFHGRHSASK